MARSQWNKLGYLSLFALGAACSSAAVGASGGSGSTTTASSGDGGATTTSSTKSTTAVTTGSVGAGGMGGGATACDPPAQPGTFYAQTAEHYGDIAPTSMCDYRGDVVLLVNTAAV